MARLTSEQKQLIDSIKATGCNKLLIKDAHQSTCTYELIDGTPITATKIVSQLWARGILKITADVPGDTTVSNWYMVVTI